VSLSVRHGGCEGRRGLVCDDRGLDDRDMLVVEVVEFVGLLEARPRPKHEYGVILVYESSDDFARRHLRTGCVVKEGDDSDRGVVRVSDLVVHGVIIDAGFVRVKSGNKKEL